MKKKSTANDGVTNARKQQDLSEELRMPAGTKKPKNTAK